MEAEPDKHYERYTEDEYATMRVLFKQGKDDEFIAGVIGRKASSIGVIRRKWKIKRKPKVVPPIGKIVEKAGENGAHRAPAVQDDEAILTKIYNEVAITNELLATFVTYLDGVDESLQNVTMFLESAVNELQLANEYNSAILGDECIGTGFSNHFDDAGQMTLCNCKEVKKEAPHGEPENAG